MKSARIREIIQPHDNIANKVIAVECRNRFYLAAIYGEIAHPANCTTLEDRPVFERRCQPTALTPFSQSFSLG
jgi:hypothetical protein